MTTHPPAHAGGLPAMRRIQPYEHRDLRVGSEAVDADGVLLDRFSAWHEDEVPGLSWTGVLEARSFVLVVEDPDAPGDKPFLHWLIWNIPGEAEAIPAGLSRVQRPAELAGAVQGVNSGGEVGWHGAKPPPGHGVHHYHFQLFALSTRLDHLKPSAGLEEVITALKGATIAAGEFVATYERLDPVADAASPAHTGSYGADPHRATAAETAAGRAGLDADDRDRHVPHGPGGEARPAGG